MKHFLTLREMTKKDLTFLIKKGIEVKKHPEKFSAAMKNKNLLMLFEAPSLRTRLSFEIGMNQMGGNAIYYNLDESTLGKKEDIREFSRVVSRYADIVTARVYGQKTIEALAEYAEIPVINAMTNYEHPCQILSDLMTIYEKKKTFDIKLVYLGDGLNNVTHSLLFGCSIMGIDISVATPKGKDYEPDANVVKIAKSFAMKSGSRIVITNKPEEAAKNADIVYTDSWMSYRIPKSREKQRLKIFQPYQVNRKIMQLAKNDALFMHDLPATRGQEVTNDVIDSRQSIVIDQAENRLHAQKALMLRLMKSA
ncbi:MAG: ornithine carbamoyltransferase [Candidatus Aenigmarchaeota archaeon]|nr:ornithine carbamoyltransferase [Candidatus Aenigmarchaeota archaeon]